MVFRVNGRKRLCGLKNKFRRQHPLGKYIIDFYCHAKRLAVEVDGAYHLTTERKLYDEYRTAELSRLGIREIRFTNDDVLYNFSTVLDEIRDALAVITDPDLAETDG